MFRDTGGEFGKHLEMLRKTLKDIATEAGVSVMTVSLVLRDKGRVGAETRERIKRIANKLGYSPDPVLSALVYHRNEKSHVRANSCLAFLTNFATRDGWMEEAYVTRYYQGAKSRAMELGYSIEPFWLREKGMSPERLSQILQTRSIQGLIVAPVQQSTGNVIFEWDKFCAVSLCRNLISPKINVIDHNHAYSMKYSWIEAINRGYRRIGYVVSRISEDMCDSQWLGSHLIQQNHWEAEEHSESIPPLVFAQYDETLLARWIETYKPDVIISPQVQVYDYLRKVGYKIPEEIGFLHLEAKPDGILSGIRQNFLQVGVAAVELVHLEIMRLEKGTPSIRQSIAIDGSWHEGETLRPAVP